ncbi:MAG: hypothetical protein Q7O66_02675 [Dehalococcoidia bacterium]|nr:hypothetical protein [Dehalococcoidia bacterium]
METRYLWDRFSGGGSGVDAMTSERPNRPSTTHYEAIHELRDRAGQQFDPEVVEVFITALRQPLPDRLGAGDKIVG